MPLTETLKKYAATPEFWSDYRNEDIYGFLRPDLEAEPVTFPITPADALRISFSFEGTNATIMVRKPGRDVWQRVASIQDGGHPMPHALRWQEADLIGRVLALNDPELPHPGIPFLLLQPFVLNLDVADHGVAYPLAAAAWRSLGVFRERRISGMARGRAYHLAEYTWRRSELEGWVAAGPGMDEQAYDRWMTRLDLGIPDVYSLRQAGCDFPFQEWNSFMAAVERAYAGYARPAAFTADPEAVALAESLLASKDLTAAATLADRLEESGEPNRTLLNTLRSGEPTGVAWVLELLLGSAQGDIIRQLCPVTVPPPGPTRKLWLDTAEEGIPHVRQSVLSSLLEHALGSGYFVGSSGVAGLVPETTPPLTDMFWVDVSGDLDEAVALIRAVMRDRPGGYPAYLHLVDPTITDGPQLRLIPLDHPSL